MLEEHTDALLEHSRILDQHSDKLDVIPLILQKIDSLEILTQRLDERTARLPKLYDAVDAFMGEIKASREERGFMGTQLSRHEERITNLELKVA